MLAPWLWLCLLLRPASAELAIGIFAGFTTWYLEHMAAIVMCDIDVRKNFEPALQQRFGPPVFPIPQLHPEVVNVTMRMGNSHSRPELGVGTALDFMYGMDGETPVVGLIGGSGSSRTKPVASVAGVLKIPQISHAATSPSLSDKTAYPYFLRTVPPDSIQGQAFWQFIVKFDIPRAACIYTLEAYGQGLYQAIEAQAIEAGQRLRLFGVSLRFMPVTFVVEEGRAAVLKAKSIETPFIFLSMGTNTMLEILPLIKEEGMYESDYQILFSEAFATSSGIEIPTGAMKWNPSSRGPKYPLFEDFWANLTADDVVGVAARERYKLNNFRVPIEDAKVPPITDEMFEQRRVPSYTTLLFDACYAFIVAINNALQSGTAPEDVRNELLLQQLQQSHFEGASGLVTFDQNGDREASYELMNFQGDPAWPVVAMFSASTGELNLESDPYWQFGVSSPQPPSDKITCSSGSYKDDVSHQCLPCPRGFFCAGGAPQQCPRGRFSNVTGMGECLPCAQGTFASEAGSTLCSSCFPGFYGAVKGLEKCEKCPKGEYMPLYGALACQACSLGMVTEESGAQAVSECQCAEGFFMCTGTGCVPCPEGLHCAAGLGVPVQRAGYWTGGSQCSFAVLQCRSFSECPGDSALGSCAEGREGVACNNCKENYFPREDGTCSRCGPMDFAPAVLAIVGGFLFVALLINCIKLDLNQQSLNMLTVAAVGGQLVMAVQTLSSMRQLSIEWVEPVRYLIQMTTILAFDLDWIRISCLAGRDSPTMKFVGKLLVCPGGIAFLGLCWLISRWRGRRLPLDAIFNLSGILVFALFISITLVVLDPLRCASNPDGSASMASNPGIICFNSGEHTGLFVLSIFGIIAYPIAILSWATYTTLKYPGRVSSGRGLQLVHRHRFLFQRFKPERYYFGAVLLWRNCLVAIFPVIFGSVPEVQMELLGALMIFSGALQIRLWPWRTDLANYIDLVITCILQVVLLGVAPMLKHDVSTSTEVLGWILTIAVLSPVVAGVAAIGYTLLRSYRPEKFFGIFLCHHKGGAGSLCRLLKLLVAKHSSAEVFLDSDCLEDLDLIFDTIRAKTKSVVAVLTPELLKRMWCAGEIVTACKNKVRTVPLVCDGFEWPDNDALEKIETCWTLQQKQILANHGISMEDVQTAYQWLRDELKPLRLRRFGSPMKREEVVLEMVTRTGTGTKLFRPSLTQNSKVKARILVTGAVNDAEALATLEVFQFLLQKAMHKECAVVRSARELLAYKPWAYYFVVLFSRGMLRDPTFAETLLSIYVEGDSSDRQLEIVTVNADTGFEFPSPEFLTDLEQNGVGTLGPELGPHLSKAYRALLNVLALPLSPMGSEGLLEKQVSEISRRFRRYQNSVFALALDDEDDRKAPGDGVDPEQAFVEADDDPVDTVPLPELRGSYGRIGKSIAWTAAGAMVEIDGPARDPSSRERAGSVDSVPSMASNASGEPPLVSVNFADLSGEPMVREVF